MSTSVAVAAGLTVSAAAAPPVGAAAQARFSGTAAAAPGGLAGSRITLATITALHGYDAASDASGRAYVGWIGSASTAASRTVYLCTLPPGATACQGGVRSTASLGISSAAGLKVLVTAAGDVTLVWFHDTDPGSVNGTRGGRIATSTSVRGGPLSSAVDRADAPSFGQLFDARLAPDGSIWTVAGPSFGGKLEVRRGITSAATTLTAPYNVGTAQVAVSGTSAVLAVQQYGQISKPVGYTSFRNGAWAPFRNVARTWTAAANVGLAATGSGIRLLASVDNASYQPVVSKWTGTAFAPRTLTGDRDPCGAGSHDPVADASGRMADVSRECSNVAVSNLTNTTRASIFRFPAGGTFAGGNPQITTTPRGRGWVVWSVLSGTSTVLRVVPIRLAAGKQSATKKVTGGKLKLTGPASCLPPVDAKVKAKAKAKKGWNAGKVKVKLGGKKHTGKINGASLTPGATYKLKAKTAFTGGGRKSKAKVTLTFRACPAP